MNFGIAFSKNVSLYEICILVFMQIVFVILILSHLFHLDTFCVKIINDHKKQTVSLVTFLH